MEYLVVSSARRAMWTVVDVAGELDIATRGRLRRELRDVIAKYVPANVIVDLGRLEFCDASGLSVLVAGHHESRRHLGELRLVCPQGPVKHLLEVTGVDRFIPVYDSLAAAHRLPVKPSTSWAGNPGPARVADAPGASGPGAGPGANVPKVAELLWGRAGAGRPADG
ncbi:STAS domain-containing protein [Streptomyces sp. NPDC006879]|uniref:STAS domain-containing protein n=1 Tax=Streptomyces sp. NPDC006879 TaxID=3364767 RepID=UPI0036D1A247